MWKEVPGYPNYECLEDTRSGIQVRSKKRKRPPAMGIRTNGWIKAACITPVNGRYKLRHHINNMVTSFVDQVVWDATFAGKELTKAGASK